ncbi:hypothetical protein [Nocardia niwae]|uniref:hypothetical protein n=1 Tax=Nocardia niwae TaxID=626084 RepID=UPI000AD124A1|nr:hypothetical protein [Nocardia niwae]
MSSGSIDIFEMVDRFIEELGGSTWITEKGPFGSNTQPNPIAMWANEYRNGLSNPGSLGNNQSFLRLLRLCHYVAILRNSSTAHLDARISDLRDGSEERVRSAVHEIQVAGDYASRGNSVEFIPETTVRQPDMMVNGEMEVECKYKTGAFSARDKERLNLYRVLNSKLQKLYHPGVQASGIVVEATFEIEPTRQMVDEILVAIRSCLRPVRTDPLQVKSESQEYTITVVPGEQVISDKLVIPHGKDIAAGFFSLSGTGAARPDGSIGVTRPIALGLTCKVELDVISTMKSSIKSAIGQLSGQCPGVVSIDISDFLGLLESQEIPGFNEMVKSLFRSNSRISRVDLVADYFEEIEGQLQIRRQVQGLENDTARFPAPRV